jgi:hypothetical protein
MPPMVLRSRNDCLQPFASSTSLRQQIASDHDRPVRLLLRRRVRIRSGIEKLLPCAKGEK